MANRIENFLSRSDSADAENDPSDDRSVVEKASEQADASDAIPEAGVLPSSEAQSLDVVAADVVNLVQKARTVVAKLSTENEQLRQECAERDALIAELKLSREEGEGNRESFEAERKHFDEVRESLEKANARLVAQNNELMAKYEALEEKAEQSDRLETRRPVPYVAPQTSAPEEFREAIEDSDFFDFGGQSKAPEFHMPGRFFPSFGKAFGSKAEDEKR